MPLNFQVPHWTLKNCCSGKLPSAAGMAAFTLALDLINTEMPHFRKWAGMGMGKSLIVYPFVDKLQLTQAKKGRKLNSRKVSI